MANQKLQFKSLTFEKVIASSIYSYFSPNTVKSSKEFKRVIDADLGDPEFSHS